MINVPNLVIIGMSPKNTSLFSNISSLPADLGSILTDNFKSTLIGTE